MKPTNEDFSPVFIRDLPDKVRLLYGHTHDVDPQGKKVPIHCQRDLAQALGLDPADLSRAIKGQIRRSTPLATSAAPASFDYQKSDGSTDPYLPRKMLPKFLHLFGLADVPEQVQAGDEWEQLVVHPIERFCTEVKQRGGRDFLSSPWDLLVASALRAHPQWRQEEEHLTVQSAPAADWRKTTQPGAGLRFLAKGQPNPATNAVSDLPHLQAGDWARIELYVGDDVLSEHPLYVLMFQDVVLDGDARRRFIPLLPSPPSEFVMPNAILDQPGACLALPGEDTHGEAQYFEIPAGWGARRRVTAVVTQKPVAADIYAPEHGWEIGPARLERLAQRLGHQAYGAWALFTYDYLVPARP